MAQEHIARGPSAAAYPLANIAENQRHLLQQYDKIVRFHDRVIAGHHPTLQSSIPDSSARPADSAIAIDASSNISNKFPTSPNVHGQQEGLAARSSQTNASPGVTTLPRPFGSGNVEINPILLEKSDDLIKAELLLQRQRLERALREDVEQRRTAAKAAAQGEPLADFDLSDVLSKALTLVQASAPPLRADENMTAANHDAASDSFDDNTFYSSTYDTPESNLTSRVRNASEVVQDPIPLDLAHLPNPQSAAPIEDQLFDGASRTLDSNHRSIPSPHNTSTDNAAYTTAEAPRAVQVPGLNSHPKENARSSGPSQNTSGQQSHSDESANTDAVQQNVAPRRLYVDNSPPSPLVRAHELSPVAPQPSHPPQQRVAAPLPRAPASIPNALSGAPAQVAALRNEPVTVTSPESSPSGGKVSEKRKGKKKKRKADRQVPEAETTPYIKPEPRSPSPLTAPPYIRPSKRQRHSQRPLNEAEYEAPAYEAQPAVVPAYSSHPHTVDRIPIGFTRAGAYPQRAASNTVANGPSYGREYVDDRRVTGDPYVLHQQPAAYSNPEGVIWRSADPIRRVITPARAQDSYVHSPHSYRGPYEPPRMSVRPEGDVLVGQPRPPPTRIVVDAFGREYIEPPRQAVIRHSGAPPVRPDEPEVIYERTAPRAIPRHIGLGSYDEGAAIYQPSPPQYAAPRRVVTQPEYISQDYRESRQREYSSRPMAPPGEYVEIVAPPERRHLESAPREFAPRAASVRPVDPGRYEVSRDYGRVQSVRPDVPVRQYATSIHAESHREAASPYMRDYSTRPAEQSVVRQDYGLRPLEQYYEQPMPVGEDIAFIERPRGATQEVVYADHVRRDVYR